jgi:hypothetical protein
MNLQPGKTGKSPASYKDFLGDFAPLRENE